MRHDLQQKLLTLLPLSVAAFVGVGVPWLASMPVTEAAAVRYDEAQALACDASHPVAPSAAHRGGAAPTQSPQWLRQHQAEVEHCLRDGLRVVRSARAAE
jgi:hypothetical protein